MSYPRILCLKSILSEMATQVKTSEDQDGSSVSQSDPEPMQDVRTSTQVKSVASETAQVTFQEPLESKNILWYNSFFCTVTILIRVT